MTSSYPLPSIGFDTGATVPMVSEYFKYVSMDATTTRASTVMRSMPTSETRTHASMTIPLSRTRSRTSMRLVPPAARSTGIGYSSGRCCSRHRRDRSTPCHRGEPALERPDLLFQLFILRRQLLLARREVMVEAPPVETNLLGLVDRADQQADPDRQQLDFRQRHLHVAGDDKALVQHAIEDVDQTCRPVGPFRQRHRSSILRDKRSANACARNRLLGV